MESPTEESWLGSGFPRDSMALFEGAAAGVGRRFAETMGALFPARSIQWIPIAGGIAAYTGDRSPLTAVKGAGPSLSSGQMDEAERFFFDCGAASVIFELAPWICPETMAELESRGYHRVSEELVVWRPIGEDDRAIRVEQCVREICDAPTWSAILHAAFDLPETDDMLALGISMATLPGALNLGVEAGPEDFAAAAQLLPLNEVAIFGGDGTLPGYRGRGFQLLLIRERLRLAARLGASVAVAEVLPGSGSARNYLRSGFQVAYSRRHWALDRPLGR